MLRSRLGPGNCRCRGKRMTIKAVASQQSQWCSVPPPPPPRTMQPTTKEALSISNVNKRVIESEYAVRGEIVQLAQKVANEMADGNTNFPFDKLVWCNIGNPQLLGQKPVTYLRQVLALCEYPQLLENDDVGKLFPADVIRRANEILGAIPGGLGAYSESPGALVLRQMIAVALSRRDGFPCDPEDLYMTDGASPAVHYMMDLLLRNDGDGLMVPIPQYPLYSATLTLYGGKLVPYMLDENSGWGLDVGHLRDQLAQARARGLAVRGMVVINPGNPTGQCLSEENIQDVLRFCAEEQLVLIADEVYQTNIYAAGRSFNSFKKVVCQLGLKEDVPLVSLHSISKGFIGECGRRGGFMEVTGFPSEVREQILKLASINLCPNLSGQICTALMMNPPRQGEPSYPLYKKETTNTLSSLRRRAELLVASLNALPGISCNAAEGALYAFPSISIPAKAAEEAKRLGKQPDWLYCKELLEAAGIVVVPGSGFGQADGTFHFRTTFLPSEEDIGLVVENLSAFHLNFLEKYGGLTPEQEEQVEAQKRQYADVAAAHGSSSNGNGNSNGHSSSSYGNGISSSSSNGNVSGNGNGNGNGDGSHHENEQEEVMVGRGVSSSGRNGS